MVGKQDKKLHTLVMESFRDWDIDRTGMIGVDHFKTILHQLDPSFSGPKLAELMDAFDGTKSAMIDYEEFLNFLFSGADADARPFTAIVAWFCAKKTIYRISARQQVVQVLAGPYTAFMLLGDGSCCRIGPISCDHEEMLASPQPLPAIREAAGGPISRLGIDYMTLFAICSDSQEVWLQDRPGEDMCCGLGDVWFLLDRNAEDGEESDREEDDQQTEGLPRRAARICGRGVVDLAGDQGWGIATSCFLGKSVLYAGTSRLWQSVMVPNPDIAGENILRGDLHKQQELLVEIDAGAGTSRIRKTAISSGEFGVLLLEDGSIAVIGGWAVTEACLIEGRLVVPLFPGLQDIIDISADGSVLLDSYGLLWRFQGRGEALQMPIVGAEKVHRLCGDVAVVAGSDCEDAYIVGKAAAAWAQGLSTVSYATLPIRDFSMCLVSGTSPVIEAMTEFGYDALMRADSCAETGANTLARICGRPLLCEEGCDVGRLERLLADGCNPDSIVPEDGHPLLVHFADRATRGDESALGMAEAAAALVKGGANQAEAVRIAISEGLTETLKVLRSAGCKVSDEDDAKCQQVAKSLEEDED